MTNTNQMLQEAVDALQWHYDRGYPDQFTDGPRKRDARILRAIKAHLAAPGAAPSQQPAPERNEWQEAVLDQLTAHAIDAPKDEPPAAILRRIIDMAVTIALDPAVSSDAQALIDRGVAQQPARDVPSVDYPATIDALRAAVRNLEAQVAARPEFETRADDKLVRVDRWEWGIRRIVALLWGNRRTFEVDEVVQAVRELVPHPQVDDESLCQAVESWYGAAQPAHPDEFVCPHCFDEGAAPQAAQSGMVPVAWDVDGCLMYPADYEFSRLYGMGKPLYAAPQAVPQPLTDEQEKAQSAEAKTGLIQHTTPDNGSDMQSGADAELSGNRSAGSTPPCPDTAWLIEWQAHGYGPQWWGFNHTPGRYSDWCSDANNAIRFSRREDAERMRLHVIAVAGFAGRPDYQRQVTVTEHMWPAAVPQAVPFDRTTALVLLQAASKSGDPGAISLAAQLAGAAPCKDCGYVNFKCRCAKIAPQAVPLTQDDIVDLAQDWAAPNWQFVFLNALELELFARRVLLARAHGITVKGDGNG